MGYFINCIKRSDNLRMDIKELIPDMNVRRRMSRVIRTGVSTALESLAGFEPYGKVDAIITATGLGCIADSEKFLANLLTADEQMLNPTPFIQSTFNTVGAQIALIKSLHCYNNTFSHRHTGFESALVDAMIRLDSGKSKAVLIGVFDEVTDTVRIIMERMGLLKEKALSEGAIFFVLTHEVLETSVAEIEEITFGESDNCKNAVSVDAETDTVWCGATAQTIIQATERGYGGYVLNDMGGEYNSLIKIRCL